ncbi:MAG: endonuclease [Muribaculaceae bacterium]
MIKIFKTLCIVATSFIISFTALAEIPTGYYNSLNGKTKDILKTELFNVISPHTQLTYNSLWGYFRQTDVHPYPDQDRWWDMYSNIPFYVSKGDSWEMNREHSFPKSWWGGDKIEPYTDINHLYPSEKEANLAKSNYPLGTVAQTTFDNGVTKVGYPVEGQGGGANQVFEPADEYKGDFARTYFYMVTCYQNLKWKYTYMLQQNQYPTLKPWAYELLLDWSRKDPVSQKEIDRNNEVYKIQNNRNPYIDYPQLAEYIWGKKVGEPFYTGNDEPIGDPTLITPTQGTALDFSEIAQGNSQTLDLFIKGDNIVKSITITITGENKAFFKTQTKSIPANLINSGYRLSINYSPSTIGNHNARLIISDGGIVGSIGISLIGQCLPIPTLTQLTANPAQNVTTTNYRATWNNPTEVVDYFIVTRTLYVNGTATTKEYIAEENYYEFDDLQGTSQTYSVQSSRLGYKSPASNTIFVYPAGVTGVENNKALAVANINGGIRFICSTPHTNAIIYDMQGREIKRIPTIENNDIITLPFGAYLVRTTENAHPIKIFIK